MTATTENTQVTLNSRRGDITFNKDRTDGDAIAIARTVIAARNASDFLCDLVSKFDQYGRLSAKQLNWLHYLAYGQTDNRVNAPQTPAADAGTYTALIELLDRANAAGIQYPKVRLQTADGSKVVLARAGSRSRREGTINITDGRPYGANTWYGRIERDGSRVASRSWTVEVRDAIVAFRDDPASIGGSLGRMTGNCCFCGRDLRTRESVGVGYGPICAGHWGLPWGSTEQYDAAQAAIVRPEGDPVHPPARNDDVCGGPSGAFCSQDCTGCGGPFPARDPNACDSCGTVTELFHNEATDQSVCSECDYEIAMGEAAA